MDIVTIGNDVQDHCSLLNSIGRYVLALVDCSNFLIKAVSSSLYGKMSRSSTRDACSCLSMKIPARMHNG